MLNLKEIKNIENEGFYKKAKLAFSKIKNIKELKIKTFLGFASGTIVSFISLLFFFILPLFNSHRDPFDIFGVSLVFFAMSFLIGLPYMALFSFFKTKFFSKKINFINSNSYFYLDTENFYDKKNVNDACNSVQELNEKSKFLIKYNLNSNIPQLKT